MNNVQIQGRVPFEIKFFAGEGDKKSFAQFTVGVNTGVKDEATGYYKEDLFRCKAFGYSAEHLNKFFQPQDQVTFDGKLIMGQDWTDANGELKQGGVEILVGKVYGFGSKGKEEGGSNAKGAAKATKPAAKQPAKPATPGKPSKPAMQKPKAPAFNK